MECFREIITGVLMKFLVDMVLSPGTVDFLKNKGYNVIRVNEVFEGGRIDDKRIFKYARENNYCIITADLDFGEILAFSQSKNPSTIILRLEDPRIPNVNSVLEDSLPKIAQAIEDGSIIIIEDKKIRIRELPI